MQETEHELKDNIPTAALIFHHKKERSHLPPHSVLQTPSQADQTMVGFRGQGNPIYGPQ
jgi:hypothetical protein